MLPVVLFKSNVYSLFATDVSPYFGVYLVKKLFKTHGVAAPVIVTSELWFIFMRYSRKGLIAKNRSRIDRFVYNTLVSVFSQTRLFVRVGRKILRK